MRLKLRLFIVSLIVGMGLVKGQNLEYGVGVDTNYMMIGDTAASYLQGKE